ncbi:hypothetical protein [Flavobacterium alkalisoli]|uniref:hypothetical protein n=1 Tax=Flavobacterium alkalisoli TaxID=2602769 RepID=UPI003A952EB1
MKMILLMLLIGFSCASCKYTQFPELRSHRTIACIPNVKLNFCGCFEYDLPRGERLTKAEKMPLSYCTQANAISFPFLDGWNDVEADLVEINEWMDENNFDFKE